MARQARVRTAFPVRLEADLVEFLDSEGKRLRRSRNWLIEDLVRRWKRRLDVQRSQRDRYTFKRKRG